MQSTATSTAFAILALLTLVAATGSLLQLHRLAPEVSPVGDAVSDYGAGRHANWYRIQVILVGLGALAIWGGLRAASFDGRGTAWLVVFAASRILIAGFPVDLPGTDRTSTGTIHNLLAVAAFASIAVAATTVGPSLIDQPGWAFDTAWFRWSGYLVAVVAIALAVFWVAPRLRRTAFGLVERCWYAAMLLWLLLTALGLLAS